jgi:HNH endonuclease
MTELRAIAGFPGYLASDDGRIYSERQGFRLEIKQRIHKDYLHVNAKTGLGRATMRTVAVHRLVLIAFAGPAPFEGADGRHKNGDQLDCRASNLEWGTRKQNIADARRHGTHVSVRVNERVGMRRLLDADVAALRGASPEQVRQMAIRLGVTPAYALAVARGRHRGLTLKKAA